jgi:hypothetical protein
MLQDGKEFAEKQNQEGASLRGRFLDNYMYSIKSWINDIRKLRGKTAVVERPRDTIKKSQ